MNILGAGVQVVGAAALVVLHVHQVAVQPEHGVAGGLAAGAEGEAARQCLARLPAGRHEVAGGDAAAAQHGAGHLLAQLRGRGPGA